MKNHVMISALILTVSLAVMSCQPTPSNSNQQNSNQAATPAKTAKWVAQYQSPASKVSEGLHLATYSYNDISVVSASVVFVASDMPDPGDAKARIGVVLRTTDGGQNWTEFRVQTSGMKVPVLNAIHFVNPNLGWVVGATQEGAANAGVVLKTTDGGETWAASKLAFKQIPTSIFFADENNGWMGGATTPIDDIEDSSPSDILATTDGGATWRSQRHVSVTINDVFFLDKMNGWAGGTKGAIYHTTDGGLTWSTQRSGMEPGGGTSTSSPVGRMDFSITALNFVDGQHGWATASDPEAEEGRVIGTENGGNSWAMLRILNGGGARGVFFVDPNNGWISTDQGQYLYHSSDGGHEWGSERIEFTQEVPIYKLGAADLLHVWAVGGGAIFYRVVE